MRVLMLSKACIVGIYQRKLELIGQQHDIQLRVLVPPYWKDERGITKLERVSVDGYELRETPMRFNGWFHIHYYPRFKQELREFQPDIVHIDEEPYNLASWFALRASRQLAAKTLFFSWQNINRQYPWPFSWIERYVLNHVDYALVGTQSAAGVWREKGYSGPLAIVPQFGVDHELFHPLAETATGHSIMVGYVGRLVEEKGIDLILSALAQLQTYDWRLEIIGGGPIREQLETHTRQLGIDTRVNFSGLLPSVAMPEVFRKLDILVIPSRTRPNWKEQYGRVILEAMASGVVVIGSDSGAIPDVIGSAGMVFPEDDLNALTSCLDTVFRDKVYRRELAEKGRQHVISNYTQTEIAAQTVDVYRQLIK